MINNLAKRYPFTKEELDKRFENDFPFIFLGDKIKISSIWAGKNKNPDEGREGVVVNIEHGMQSTFNRDYLILTIKEDLPDRKHFSSKFFDALLYTLDLKSRGRYTKDIDDSKRPIYIDDVVEAKGTYYNINNGKYLRSENPVGNVRKMFFVGYNPLEKIRAEIRNENDSKTYFAPYNFLSLVERFPPNQRFLYSYLSASTG